MLDPLAVFLGNAFAERGLTPIPLVSTDHEVAVAAGLAVVTTHRLFRNAESANIEAVLTFPVPVHATLFDLTAEIEGRKLHAKAQARSQAREAYEDAVTRGKSAVLHEELLKGIHMVSVANIQPGGEIKVTTKWATPLSVGSGRATLRIPQTVGDVYGRSGLVDADDLLMGGPAQRVMVSIQSADQVEVIGAELLEGRATVSSAEPIDLIMSPWEALPITGRDAEGRLVSLTLTGQPEGEAALNLAVLVDHSGSMQNRATSQTSCSAHDAARSGVARLADSLAAGDVIDLWEFDTHYRQVGLVEVGPSDLPSARERLACLAMELSSPRGGTAIGGALQAVMNSSSTKDILLLTDGRSHQLNIEELARCGRRISVILIGADSLEARIGHLAALTGGDLFIATADDLADVMASATAALRRPAIAPPLVTGVPDELMCLRNNVELRVTWAQAEGGPEYSTISRAAAAVAASLVVNCADPEFAAQYAEGEGIVTHLTSLILIDEAGEARAELPAMRKVALPGVVRAMRGATRPMFSHSYDLASSGEESASYSAMRGAASSVPPSPRLLQRAIRREPPSLGSASASRPDALRTIQPINWGDAPERLLDGDISRLNPEAQLLINELSANDYVRRLSVNYEMPAQILTIALLAHLASAEDRRAQRVWSAILHRLREQISTKMRRDYLQPIHHFLAEIELRASDLLGKLARSVDGDVERGVMEIAQEAQSRSIALNRELAFKAEERLEELIRARLAQVEQDFTTAHTSLMSG